MLIFPIALFFLSRKSTLLRNFANKKEQSKTGLVNFQTTLVIFQHRFDLDLVMRVFYELSHELPNDLRLSIFENLEIKQNLKIEWVHRFTVHSSLWNFNFCQQWSKLTQKQVSKISGLVQSCFV